jgi:hypothetical protein
MLQRNIWDPANLGLCGRGVATTAMMIYYVELGSVDPELTQED